MINILTAEAGNYSGLIIAIISLVATLLPVLIGFIMFVIKTFKNKDWKTIMKVAEAAMKEVETYSSKMPITSEEKLNMAMEIIQKSLQTADIDFDDKTKEKTKTYIKECIKWFNSMNGKNK